jgi:hypothetical protein
LRDRVKDVYGSIAVRGPDESCKTCKGARGICRRWNTPGHLYDYKPPQTDYGTMAQAGQSPRRSGVMSISSLAAAAAASHSGSDGSSTGACVSL